MHVECCLWLPQFQLCVLGGQEVAITPLLCTCRGGGEGEGCIVIITHQLVLVRCTVCVYVCTHEDTHTQLTYTHPPTQYTLHPTYSTVHGVLQVSSGCAEAVEGELLPNRVDPLTTRGTTHTKSNVLTKREYRQFRGG